ncbi:unnamed protein product [Sphenostylis stenocarpa]|uniref:Uncharacterized protein n=1 Tax=Sphenostylis stenocarpa TaxID=92480 RepID=A0AA86SKM1_9FABA|nr:unnamed protein product [Sphenostylis stenocarpa]
MEPSALREEDRFFGLEIRHAILVDQVLLAETFIMTRSVTAEQESKRITHACFS